MKMINAAGVPVFPKTEHRLTEVLVESSTTRNDFYHVVFACTCKGYIFNGKCKHIQMALDAQ